MNKCRVRQEIDEAYNSYQICWGYLCRIKSHEITIDTLTKFQPTLYASLSKLSNLYREIAQLKKSLINHKADISRDWFVRRMKSLSSYQKSINDTIAIGKSIGDAFVWLFYQNNRYYLVEHLSQDEIFHTPPGTGGFGEQAFIKNNPVLNGYFILHHGVTNILRLGDVTLIDLDKFEVAGVGEIKTSGVNQDGTVHINLIFSGPNIDKDKVQRPIPETEKDEPSFIKDLPEKSKQRLKRQIERINKSYNTLSTKPRLRLEMKHDNCLERFEHAFTRSKVGKFHFHQLTHGFMIGIYREKRKLFSSKMLNQSSTDFSEKLNGIGHFLKKIMKDEREDNSLEVGYFHYINDGKSTLLPGMTHPAWWPINNSILEDIIFQNSIVVTFYNPAHLISEFEKHGYALEYKKHRVHSINQKIGNMEFSVHGFDYYSKMITQYLFTEESIVEIIEETKGLAKQEKSSQPFKIELNIQQHL